MSLTSREVNLLVFRYLQESGFRHSAFTFGHESLLARTSVVDADLPYGSLVGLLQKGIQYVEIERQVSEGGVEASHDHSTSLEQDAKVTDTTSESSSPRPAARLPTAPPQLLRRALWRSGKTLPACSRATRTR